MSGTYSLLCERSLFVRLLMMLGFGAVEGVVDDGG